MLKASTKRRRTKTEMESAKLESFCREDAVADKNREITALQNEVKAMSQ